MKKRYASIKEVSEYTSLSVKTLYDGASQGELLSLQWDRVNLFRRTVIIQESKSGKPRTLPVNQIAFDILEERSKIRNIMNYLDFVGRGGGI